MLWADNFTRSEYVGFVDADTVFISYVDREGEAALVTFLLLSHVQSLFSRDALHLATDLFENGKPVMHGRIGVDKTSPWANAPAGTQVTPRL